MKRTTSTIAIAVAMTLLAAACGRAAGDASPDDAPATTTAAATDAGAPDCTSEAPEATDIGVTADTITIETLADVGSPLSPGLFQANLDAVQAFADAVNAQGGLACRTLEVKTWDTKLTPEEAKNGQLDACASALALVGGNSLFNPDVSTMVSCPDVDGAPTGLPDISALANDVNELCSPVTYNIQIVAETCPVASGVRPMEAIVGPTTKVFLKEHPDLHGVFAVPGDLPTTVQSAMPIVVAQEQAGVTWDALVKVSGRDEQATYVPKVLALSENGSNYFYSGSGDQSMVLARQEAAAQGVDVDVWACALGCYTEKLLAGGDAVEGTYVWMQFLPFEEADTNAELAAYLDAVGRDQATSFGAQAWQAAVLFRTAVDQVVAEHGINGVTRANLLAALDGIDEFTANGWMGAKDLKGTSDCFVLLQVQDGAFQRVFPEERGTLDCDPANVATVQIDPATEAARVS